MNTELDNFHFKENDTIVLGCSSGPDSMALFHMLLKLREKYKLNLICAHVNHNMRKQSAEEYAFLEKYCDTHNVAFEGMIIKEYGDDNFHNEARNIRYHFFEDIVLKYDAKYLITAHHGDDLVETILMRISRGSNLQGYSGFHEIVDMDSYKIIRPLINFTKEEILEYDKKNKVPYYIDESNNQDKYTRNRYRKYILPFLKEENKDIHLKFLKFSRNLTDAYKFIEQQRNKAMKKVIEEEKVQIDEFLKIDEYLQREILYYLVSEYYQDDLLLINDRHIDLMLDTIKRKKSNITLDMPNDVCAIKSYNEFYLKRNTEDINEYEIQFDTFASLPNHHTIEKVDKIEGNSNNICRLNSEEITLPLTIRTRNVGDKIAVKGLNGTKKVKDIFIDKKIPLTKRELWPIVTDAKGNIVWIPGIKKSKFDKKKQETYDIILKYK